MAVEEKPPSKKASYLSKKRSIFAAIGDIETSQDAVQQISEATDLITQPDTALDYKFLLKNLNQFKMELEHLLAAVEDNNHHHLLLCYVWAEQLETFYRNYSYSPLEKIHKKAASHGQAEKYAKIKHDIEMRLKGEKQGPIQPVKPEFAKKMRQDLLEGLENLLHLPLHLTAMQNQVAMINLTRLYWVFMRFALSSSLPLLLQVDFVKKMQQVFGSQININNVVKTMQIPNGILNYFSVGLFLVRSMIDIGLIIKHVAFRHGEEKNVARLDILQQEMKKRAFHFANDFAWATVNFLTNFSRITHLSAPISGALTAAFLGFDVAMILIQLTVSESRFRAKEKEYKRELAEIEDQLRKLTEDCHSGSSESEEQKQKRAQLLVSTKILNKQMISLHQEWKTERATFCFQAAAASLLMLGFTSALLFTPPGMMAASFFVCTLAAAMYFSAGSFKDFYGKKQSANQAKLGKTAAEHQLSQENKDYKEARNEFIKTMLKNTLIPSFTIATFAVCWPAAVAFTAAYISYEIFSAYQKNKKSQENLPGPASPDASDGHRSDLPNASP